LLSAAQLRWIETFFLCSHRVLADERRAISEISFVLKNGLRWWPMGRTRRSATVPLAGAAWA
jgi:hypothetical protein